MRKKLCKIFISWQDYNSNESNLSFSYIYLSSIHKIRDWQPFLSFCISLSKEFFKQDFDPCKRDTPFLRGIWYVSHVHCHIHAIHFILPRGIKIVSSHSNFEFSKLCKVLWHICCKYHIYNSFSNISLHIQCTFFKDIQSFLCKHFVSWRYMMAFKNRYVIISCCKFVSWIYEEKIVIARMFKIVNACSKTHREKVKVIKFSFLHPISPHYEIIHSLANISCMCFVMVRNRLIPTWYVLDKS